MFVLNGELFHDEIPQSFGDNHYPAYAFTNDPDLRAQYGITEVFAPEPKNPRFYDNYRIAEPPFFAVTPRSLDDIKEMLWTDIKRIRDAKIQENGFNVGTKWYHSDVFSRSQQLGLVLLGTNIPNGLMWKTMDGTFVNMTPTLAQQILGAGAMSDTSLFTAAEVHHATINAALDIETLEAYDINSGWPAGFLET